MGDSAAVQRQHSNSTASTKRRHLGECLINTQCSVYLRPTWQLGKPTREAKASALLQDIHVAIHRGEHVAVVGHSGAGKSLLGRALAGALPTTVRLEGTLTRPKRVAMIDQRSATALNPLVRVGKQIALSGQDPRDMLKTIGLLPVERFLQSYPGELSGGQAQRVALALNVLSQPDVLIADECTTALDPITVQQVITVLKKVETLVLVTHDLAVASALCERMVVIDGGRIVDDLPLQQALAGKGSATTQSLCQEACLGIS